MRTLCFGRGTTLVALGLLLTTGCFSDPDGKTALFPEGDPEVLEIFVTEPAAGTDQLMLAYRAQVDESRLAKLGLLELDDEGNQVGRLLPDWDESCPLFDQANPDACDATVDQAVPGPGQKIRVILDELLDGSTVEQFQCACAATADGACDNNIFFSTDPADCGDDPGTTPIETGRFADADFDGAIDDTVLLAGIVSIDCGGGPFVWTSAEDDGWYNPSGNQFPAIDAGQPLWDSLGPALVLTPPAIPTNRTCSIITNEMGTDGAGRSLAAVRDKDGNPIPAAQLSGATFQTQPLRVVTSTPADGATGVMLMTAAVVVTFNAPVDADSAQAIVVSDGMNTLGTLIAVPDDAGTGVAIREPRACAVSGCMDPMEVDCSACNDPMETPTAPPLPLQANTTYTVTIPVDVTDTFTSPLPAEHKITFTTGAM